MATTISTYLSIENNLSRVQASTAKTPAVQVATQYFQKNIGNVTSAQQLVNNQRLLSYALTAFGLGDKINEKGLIQKVLQQGVANPHALANTLSNSNIYAFAKAFDFVDKGASAPSSSTNVANVVNKYIENSLESAEGQQNPGVQLALYFQQHAPSITGVYNILADKNLLTVVQTALGISPLTGIEPIDTQAKTLLSRLKSVNFKDPTQLKKFIERFAANYDTNNASSATGGYASASATTPLTAATTGANPVSTASLFQTNANAAAYGISATTLLNARNARLGVL